MSARAAGKAGKNLVGGNSKYKFKGERRAKQPMIRETILDGQKGKEKESQITSL